MQSLHFLLVEVRIGLLLSPVQKVFFNHNIIANVYIIFVNSPTVFAQLREAMILTVMSLLLSLDFISVLQYVLHWVYHFVHRVFAQIMATVNYRLKVSHSAEDSDSFECACLAWSWIYSCSSMQLQSCTYWYRINFSCKAISSPPFTWHKGGFSVTHRTQFVTHCRGAHPYD